jgi:hypothetical protein
MSIPWCVWPSLGQPKESTKEFSPATGHTCSEPSGLGVWPRNASSFESELRVDALLDRAELLRDIGLALLEVEQVVTLTTELLSGDLLPEDQVPILLRHRPEELEPIGEVRERTR